MKPEVIFFGNGMLADYALAVVERECQVIFHARTKEDLAHVMELKHEHPAAYGILASYGIMVPTSVLELFEPEGILNIHPSLLPLYRGASPIESAILAGETDFSVSVMKLVKAMDAGPLYYQETISGHEIAKRADIGVSDGIPLAKSAIYQSLAEAGAEWLVTHLSELPEATPQDDAAATFTSKLTKPMGLLDPATDTAEQLFRKIVAFAGFPKAKIALYGQNCIVLRAHMLDLGSTAPLTLTGSDGQILAIDCLQPEGKRPMDAKSFLNGYRR